MNRGFVFSIIALFGAAIVIMLSGILIMQLELSAQSNPYVPMNLDENDFAIVGSYFPPPFPSPSAGIAGPAHEAKDKLTLASIITRL